jgi:hypothetical protein
MDRAAQQTRALPNNAAARYDANYSLRRIHVNNRNHTCSEIKVNLSGTKALPILSTLKSLFSSTL